MFIVGITRSREPIIFIGGWLYKLYYDRFSATQNYWLYKLYCCNGRLLPKVIIPRCGEHINYIIHVY